MVTPTSRQLLFQHNNLLAYRFPLFRASVTFLRQTAERLCAHTANGASYRLQIHRVSTLSIGIFVATNISVSS